MNIDNNANENISIIDLEHVSISFGSTVTHQNVNLSLKQGLSYAIVGKSGSGKSVLIKAILGLLPISKGEILFNGEKADFRLLRKACGVQLQNGALLNSLNVLENVMLPLRYGFHASDSKNMKSMEYELNDDDIQAIAMAKLQMVGLQSEHYLKNPSELSGGMIKRVSLARALALDPLVLILDEPTSGLDQKSVVVYSTLLKRLHIGLGLTTVMITHDLDLAREFADMIIVVHEKHVYCDTYEAIMEHPVFHQYLSLSF